MSPLAWIGFVIAAGIGAPTRFIVESYVQERSEASLPLGTFVVNVSGSFLLGIVSGLFIYHGLSGSAKNIVGIGFIGAYTTFSTFSVEAVRRLEDGAVRDAVTTVVASGVVGCLAAALGLWLAAAL